MKQFIAGVAVGATAAGLAFLVLTAPEEAPPPPVAPPSPAAPDTPARRAPASAAPMPSDDPAALDARIEELEAEVKRLELERAIARGQVLSHEGEAVPWPEDLPAAYRPATVEQRLRDALPQVADAELVEIDCTEYPCIAWMRSHSEADPEKWTTAFEPVHEALKEGLEDARLTVNNYGEDPKLQAVALWAGDPEGEEDLSKRLDFRLDAAAADYRADLATPGEPR